MNSPSNNQPRPAAVAQGPLPPLPAAAGDITGIPGASPQHYEDGYTADQMNAHALTAWNMGLDAGLLNAPAITDTGLPELRDHLATAKVMDRSITLSPAAAAALHLAMTTPPSEAESATTAPQVAGYIEPQEIPCIGQCRTTLWATKQSPDALAVYMPAPLAPDAPPFKEDPLDIVRTLLFAVDGYYRRTSAFEPSPIANNSPVILAARRACVERGYTAGGLAISQVSRSDK